MLRFWWRRHGGGAGPRWCGAGGGVALNRPGVAARTCRRVRREEEREIQRKWERDRAARDTSAAAGERPIAAASAVPSSHYCQSLFARDTALLVPPVLARFRVSSWHRPESSPAPVLKSMIFSSLDDGVTRNDRSRGPSDDAPAARMPIFPLGQFSVFLFFQGTLFFHYVNETDLKSDRYYTCTAENIELKDYKFGNQFSLQITNQKRRSCKFLLFSLLKFSKLRISDVEKNLIKNWRPLCVFADKKYTYKYLRKIAVYFHIDNDGWSSTNLKKTTLFLIRSHVWRIYCLRVFRLVFGSVAVNCVSSSFPSVRSDTISSRPPIIAVGRSVYSSASRLIQQCCIW